MAYKQTPGRSPFLKTGRDIPLNMTSPLHQQKWWGARLADEVKKEGGVGGGGVKSVAKTTAKNLVRGARELVDRGLEWEYKRYGGETGNFGTNAMKRSAKWKAERSGKDVFAK